MMDRQITLGDCKPGQIVVFANAIIITPYKIRDHVDSVTRLMSMEDYSRTSISRSYPCRLATQAELDQLAERIRKAND